MPAEKKVREVTVRLPKAHPRQQAFISSKAKRKVIRAGRRGGKTVGVAILAVYAFLAGRRVLYAAPTMEQVARFWTEVTRAMAEPIAAGALRKNETEHLIERRGTEARIRAKTAWNADSLRGDYADLLILDEWQLMDEAAWEEVGAPMLLDNNGDAVFIYTPPSLRSRSVSKAHDPQHAAKLFKKAQTLSSGGRWATFTFSSFDNPHISREALDDIIQDMTAVAYRQEIMAEDVDEAPGAMWTREMLEDSRVTATPPDVVRRVVGLDPSTTSSGDDAGIITVAQCGDDLYVEADNTLQGSPAEWAEAACTAAHDLDADGIVAEKNQGGEMVSLTIATIDQKIPVWLVHASRGKEPRAQPVASATRQGKVHMVGQHPALEDELCLAAGTMITTKRGDVPIECITPGDQVLTRAGYRAVLHAGMTSSAASVISIETRSGRALLTTHCHPLYIPCADMFVPAGSTQEGICLTSLVGKVDTERASSYLEFVGTRTRRDTITTGKAGCCTEWCMSGCMGCCCLQNNLSTTSTATEKTTIQKICRWFLRQNTSTFTLPIGGTRMKRADCLGNAVNIGNPLNRANVPVRSVERGTRQSGCEPSSVPANVLTDTIIALKDCEQKIPVFNLTVEHEHEYFANGILVHNCLWVPGDRKSPNRLDALVWACSWLMGISDGQQSDVEMLEDCVV